MHRVGLHPRDFQGQLLRLPLSILLENSNFLGKDTGGLCAFCHLNLRYA